MNLKKLEEKLGIKIENKQLFEDALTHISYLNEHPQVKSSNEKLEFLGDSIISFVVADHLFKNYPDLCEGDYTDIRGKLVCRDTLGKVGSELRLGKFLKLSKGEEKIGGRKKLTILADTYEAVVGAIYLQSGLKEAKKFIQKTLIEPYLSEIIKKRSYLSPKTRLQEYLQKKYHSLPKYKVIKTSGPEHRKVYEVAVFFNKVKLAEGKEYSKKKAEEKAAELALEKIEKKEVEI